MNIRQQPTAEQLIVLNAVRDLYEKHTHGPTTGEVAKVMKMNRNTASSHLRALRGKGLLKVGGGGFGFVPCEAR